MGQLGEMQQRNSASYQERVSMVNTPAPGAPQSLQRSQPLKTSFLWENIPRMFCCLLEKFSCSQGHNLSQLVVRVPDHNQDSNEPRVCRAVLFKGEGRKLSVSICYKQHSAGLQVSWPSAQDLLLHTKTHRWGSRIKNSPPQRMVDAGTICSSSSIKGLCSKPSEDLPSP